MNAVRNLQSIALSLLLAAGWVTGAGAQELRNMDHLTVEKGVVVKVTGDKAEPLKEPFLLPGGARLLTNAVLVLPSGEERQFAEGRKLTLDGFYLSGELLVPLTDHLLAQAGRAVIYRDGQPTPVSGEIVLKNGTRVQDNVIVTRPNGERLRMQDGQQFALDGTPLPGFDHVTRVRGRVRIQKEGSILNIEPWRTMAMNDGTRVTGAGEVTTRDGRKFTLGEGAAADPAGHRVRVAVGETRMESRLPPKAREVNSPKNHLEPGTPEPAAVAEGLVQRKGRTASSLHPRLEDAPAG